MAESIKYCRNCGNKLDAGAKFCRKCGFQVGTGQKPANSPGNAGNAPANTPGNAANAGNAPVRPAPGRNQSGSYSRPGAAGTANRNPGSGSGKIIAIIAAAAAIIAVFFLVRHLIEQKGYDAFREERRERWEEYQKEQASDTNAGDTNAGDKAAGGILPSLPAKTQVAVGEATVVGSVQNNGFSLQIEEDAFPEGMVVSVEPVSSDLISRFQNPEEYQLISAPVMIECESYEGEFFDSDVVLTVPIPEGEERLDRLAFVYFDDKAGEERILWPDSFDLQNRTMSVALPHFSGYASLTLQQKKQIDEFLNEYSKKVVEQQDCNRQAAEALEPYVRAHVEAMGLRDDAAKDLINSTINYLGGCFKGDEFDPNPHGNTIETGVKTGTTLMQAVLEGDLESQEESLQDIVTGAIMHAWDEQGLTDKINEAKDSEFKGGAAEFVVGNTNALVRMSARMAEGDWEGAAEELGGIMQGVHPAVEFTTKGTVFLARQMDLMFIEWKQGEIEELYHVYKNGAEGLFGNYVLPYDQDTNHESFLTFINTSSGFVKGKMVNRFYSLDKIKEVCDKYGWDFDDYKELAEKNRDIFEQRAQDALLEYFDTRIRQEAEQDKIKEKERVCIETMLNSELGVLTSGYWSSFFGESEANPYNMRNRLDRLVRVRSILSQYVDEEELDRLTRAGSFNWGDLLNNWVSLVSSYPREEALQRFLRYLQEIGVLKDGMEKLIREEVPDADTAQAEEKNAEEDTEKEAADKEEAGKEDAAKKEEGYWRLKETNIRVEKNEIGVDASYYYSASELTHSENVSRPETRYHGAGSATLITNCSAPPQNIRPGEEVVMHLSTDATYGGDYLLWSVTGYVEYGSPNDERDGIMYNAGIKFEPVEDYGENTVYMDPYDNKHTPNADVVHEFGKGGEPGSEMAILFYGSSSVTLWIYEWVE
ncbi:MAG: zinc-ribbon domain-containing protein [Lachnospiraceae bacterium]|nr:zinc-ribbon domain-containing protein [Lachnospiraceae bacterium]MBQ6635858.1 zinc-ribbon domain-containing protein [Lachnospiraceae bacterium]